MTGAVPKAFTVAAGSRSSSSPRRRGGRGIEESRLTAVAFEKAGCHALDCDNGSCDSRYRPHPPSCTPKACNLKDVAVIKGGVFVSAAAPDFMDDDKRLLAWYKRQMKDLKIDVRMRSEAARGLVLQGGYDEVFVATGANERRLGVPGLDSGSICDATGTFRNPKIPCRNVLVMGGGLSAANHDTHMDFLDLRKVSVIKNASFTRREKGVAHMKVVIRNTANIANGARLPFAIGPEGLTMMKKIPVSRAAARTG